VPLIKTVATGVTWDVTPEHAEQLLEARDIDGQPEYLAVESPQRRGRKSAAAPASNEE
jgi:hypothetical protein